MHDSQSLITPLLSPDDPPPWQIEHAEGISPLLILCDHAGTEIPARLGRLGLDERDLQRHIGWDIGAAAVSRKLGDALDATVILQPYSRLVIDCNRMPGHAESIVSISETTPIPANEALSAQQRRQREAEIFSPYHAVIEEHLDLRARRGQSTLLLMMHSFTPVYMGQSRPWHAGVLYHRDARMAQRLGELLRADLRLLIGDNQPYAAGDDSDYAVPVYGERRGLPHVELEIRQDLIADESGQRVWAETLAHKLRELLQSFSGP